MGRKAAAGKGLSVARVELPLSPLLVLAPVTPTATAYPPPAGAARDNASKHFSPMQADARIMRGWTGRWHILHGHTW
jgi:hypothetical protein